MTPTTRRLRCAGRRWLFALVVCWASEVGAGDYLGPLDLVATPDHRTLFVALHDAEQLGVFDIRAAKLVRRIDLPGRPTGLALDPAKPILYVSCAAPKSTVCAVNLPTLEITQQYTAGHTASGVAIDAKSQRLYVCNRFDHDVSVIDLKSGQEIDRVPVVREPVGAVVASEDGSVFVINHLPLDPSNRYDVAAEVTIILPTEVPELGEDVAADQQVRFRTRSLRLPNGSTSCLDIAISPDGRSAYVTHTLARYQLPATQLERGWMNTNALSILDLPQQTLLNTVLLDSVDQGAANPWGVTVTADGSQLVVTHAGSQEVSLIDLPSVMEMLHAAAAGTQPAREGYADVQAENIPNDLALLDRMRRRISLTAGGVYGTVDLHAPDVAGPRGVAVVGSRAYVACYFTDNLAIVDLERKTGDPVQLVGLGPPTQMDLPRIGEMLFNDARLCFQQWQSCASCHPDGRMDGLNWDLLNDGLGNGKNAKSMLLADRTPPAMVSGVRGDAGQAVRAGIRHILFTVRPEKDAQAIQSYLAAMAPVPSPHLVDGQPGAAAQRGQELFFSARVGCFRCHPQPLYTDLRMHDVGSQGEYDRRADFDTPTLIESWRTAPYLHDGRYTTVEELLRVGKHGFKAGDVESLSDAELADLVEWVLSL